MNKQVVAIGIAILAVGFWLLNTAGGRSLTKRVTDNIQLPKTSVPHEQTKPKPTQNCEDIETVWE